MRAIECPCGHHLEGADDEVLFRLAREHVDRDHPEMQRTDEQLRERIAADAYDLAPAGWDTLFETKKGWQVAGNDKVVINLATGLEDAERVTVAFLVGGAALEKGKRVAMFLTKEAVRLGLPGYADAVACDGCPPLERLFKQFSDGGGELLVCPICFSARKLEESGLVGNARLAGASPLWEWIGDGATVFSYWEDARMAIDVDIDVELLKSEIKKTYGSLSRQPEQDFVFPTGRAWAEDLDYPDELAHVPDRAVESFAGVANPFSLGRLNPGERVLDLGCGAGTDSLVAAQMIGAEGHVTGLDMTQPMLAKARAAAAEAGATNVDFVEGEAERLPFADESFDVVISNGVIDLIPDKDAVFSELHRVLVPGGRLQIADVTIQNPVSADARRDIDLWTGWIAGALLEAAYAKLLERHGFERIETGQLVDTYARSKFEDTRRKARKFGARGTTTKAYKPERWPRL